jgi:hypothetical protein
MWLFTLHGFYSIVKKDHDYHVRSRDKQDLENLRKVIPGLPPVQASFEGSDYPFRLILREDEKVTRKSLRMERHSLQQWSQVLRSYLWHQILKH